MFRATAAEVFLLVGSCQSFEMPLTEGSSQTFPWLGKIYLHWQECFRLAI